MYYITDRCVPHQLQSQPARPSSASRVSHLALCTSRPSSFLLAALPFGPMASLRSWLRLTTVLIIASGVLAAPALQTKRAAITQVSQSQLDSFTPIAHYASAGYCTPSSTLAWNCANCGANPSFQPVASGGDGATVQYCECSRSLGHGRC